MGLIEFLILLIVAAVCGAIGQSLAGYTTGGCLTSIVVGFIGSYLGLLIARNLGLPELLALQIGGQAFPIIWSIIGATLFTFILALLNRAFVRRRP
ncbi:hypothetical protein [Nodosilinea sp. P-1105]|uniref:GlsB/YeaQ/YmgE family stress response membrane protein n=1 Tax=Nodosilinea sp. P-1105 TaxID=2546229 RepID=UPI00146E7097|nr:hypothetical protein [Nodosilinea sp. P-1105]NMF83644.1 hypothetical protein [Nodosilinea sp. P-1105]